MNTRNDSDIIELSALTDQERRAIDYLALGDYHNAVELKDFKGTLDEYKTQWFSKLTYGQLPQLFEDYKLQVRVDFDPKPFVESSGKRGGGGDLARR